MKLNQLLVACALGAASQITTADVLLMQDFSAGLEPAWQVDYLCQGPASAAWTSPVIKGDRLIVGGRGEGYDLVFCLTSNNGDLLWKGHSPADATKNHGTGMRATPAIDERFHRGIAAAGVLAIAERDDQRVDHGGGFGACDQAFDGGLRAILVLPGARMAGD